MPLPASTTGQLTKLKFTAYNTIDFSPSEKADEYEVMFNPSTMAVKLQVEREEQQGNGSTSSEMRFKMIKPQDYQFEFIIDGTGAITEDKKSVPDEVEKLLKVVYNYNGSEHKPNYVMVKYGAILLKTVMKNVDITYNLFKPDGTPLRAKINVVLTSCVDQPLSEMINDRSSPDLTHKRTLKQSETLTRLSNKIYNSNNYYTDVAKVNGFNNFRRIKPGTDIFFPPLDKTNTNAR